MKALVLVLVLSLITVWASALDYPHMELNQISCLNCHQVHDGTEELLPPHEPQDIDDTAANNVCWSCHNDIEAPYVRTHSSLTTSNKYGDWSIECRTCHNPHHQQQFRTYGSEGYLYSGTVSAITSTSLSMTGSGWVTDQYKELIVIPNLAEDYYNYKITGNTDNTLTLEGPVDLSRVSAGDSFAIVYGKLIKGIIATPNSGDREVRFYRDSGSNSFADGDTTYDGICEVCHTQTTYHRNNDTGDHTHNVGTKCTNCHGHVEGFKPGATGQGHDTHLDAVYGPAISCSDCHGSNPPPTFADGNDLANTTVCNNCHSPGGTYDGVNDPVIGAKNNWPDGVYNGTALATGKEKWCVGCHDDGSSIIQGVSAPNIAGDDSTYGYYITGHKISCTDCHDATVGHIDGIARTYVPDSDYLTYDPVSINYQQGFRLKDVATGYDGKYPLHIPRTGHVYPPGFREDWEFALCFSCHDRNSLFNGGDPSTGEGAGTNFYAQSNGDGGGNPAPTSGQWYSMHDVHTWGANGPLGPETPQYDSDWDGTADSRISCPACHNVHGSKSPAMIRTGELIGRSTALNLTYLDGTCPYDDLSTSSGGKMLTDIGCGPGGGRGDINNTGVCEMCHNRAQPYYRSPIEEENFCYTCHDSDGPASVDIQSQFSYTATGSSRSNANLNTHHDISESDQTYSGAVIECNNCHNPHIVTNSQKVMADPDPGDGRTPAGGNTWAESSYLSEWCFECHDNSYPSSVNPPTNPLTDIYERWVLSGGGDKADQHGPEWGSSQVSLRAGSGYARGDILQCSDCHVMGHGSSNLYQLKTTIYSKDGTTPLESDAGGTTVAVTDTSGDNSDPLTNGKNWCSTCHPDPMGGTKSKGCLSGNCHGHGAGSF